MNSQPKSVIGELEEAHKKDIETITQMLAQITNRTPRLVVAYGVKGVNVHDARLVAAMLVHGLTHILTFNISDFARYSEITAVHPIIN
jgi:predicted nucleic acid-binding protein